MGHQQGDVGLRDQRIARERQGLVHGEAETVHAGIDVEGRREGPSGGLNQGGPFGQFLPAPEDRAQRVRGQGGAEAGQEAVQHVDRRVRQHAPGFQRLAQVCDEERPAPGRPQHGGDPGEAAAIGVRLDHGGAGRLRGFGGEPPPVLRDGRQVDGEAGAVGRFAHRAPFQIIQA